MVRIPRSPRRNGIELASFDSTARDRQGADYVFASAENISTKLAAWQTAGELDFHFANGTYTAQNVAFKENVHIRGSGWGTRINFPASPGSEAMFVADTDANHDGGGFSDIYLYGDGTVALSKSAMSAAGNTVATPGTNVGTLDGIDFQNVTQLQNFEITRVKGRQFRRFYNGAVTSDRYIPISGCELWANHTAIYCGEHPSMKEGDFRFNYIAVGGAPFDLYCAATKMALGIYGIAKTSGGTIEGISNCELTQCQMFSNDYGAVLSANNKINGCLFGSASIGGVVGIQVILGENVITGNNFDQQTPTVGFSTGCIEFASGNTLTDLNAISGNRFRNRAASTPILAFSTESRLYSSTISNNTFNVGTGPIFEAGAQNYIRRLAFCGNTVEVKSFSDTAKAVMTTRAVNTSANTFCGNTFRVSSGVTVDSILEGSTNESIWSNNTVTNEGTITNGMINASEVTGQVVTDNVEL